jgi:hypothetical protein
MMGNAPPHVLAGRRAGLYLRNKIRLKKIGPEISFQRFFGGLVGRALVRGGHAPALVEFRRGDDLDDWRDPMKVYGPLSSSNANAGLGGKLVERAAFGGRMARDLQDYLGSRRAESASVQNFKLTPSSRNTARITIGHDRRERRKKYEWEKVGTQRKLQAGALAIGIPATLALGSYLHKRGKGSLLKGIQVVSKQGYHKTRDIGSAISAAVQGKTFVPRKGAANEDLNKKASDLAKRAAARDAGAAVDNGPIVDNPDIIESGLTKKKKNEPKAS